ncbi:MAG: hypothetical protein ACYCQJ_14135 [Nitrososphaerales archaeon]
MLPPELSEQIAESLPWQTRLDLGFSVKDYPLLQQLKEGRTPQNYNAPSPLVEAFFDVHPEYDRLLNYENQGNNLQNNWDSGEGWFITKLLPLEGDTLPVKGIHILRMYGFPEPNPLPPSDPPFTLKDVRDTFQGGGYLDRGNWLLKKEKWDNTITTYYQQFRHGPFYLVEHGVPVYKGRYYRGALVEDFEGLGGKRRLVDHRYWDLVAGTEGDPLMHEEDERSPWVIGDYVVREMTSFVTLMKVEDMW